MGVARHPIAPGVQAAGDIDPINPVPVASSSTVSALGLLDDCRTSSEALSGHPQRMGHCLALAHIDSSRVCRASSGAFGISAGSGENRAAVRFLLYFARFQPSAFLRTSINSLYLPGMTTSSSWMPCWRISLWSTTNILSALCADAEKHDQFRSAFRPLELTGRAKPCHPSYFNSRLINYGYLVSSEREGRHGPENGQDAQGHQGRLFRN